MIINWLEMVWFCSLLLQIFFSVVCLVILQTRIIGTTILHNLFSRDWVKKGQEKKKNVTINYKWIVIGSFFCKWIKDDYGKERHAGTLLFFPVSPLWTKRIRKGKTQSLIVFRFTAQSPGECCAQILPFGTERRLLSRHECFTGK